MNAHRPVPLRVVVACLALLASAWSWGADDATAFPHPIAVELGAAEFAAGDTITIESVRGDRPHLEAGGRYVIEGAYTFASADTARLSWFITSRGPSGPTPVAAEESVTISRGSGRFRLIKTVRSEGWPHVSFYVNGRSWGGVYFGESGRDATVLRTKGWSDFARAPSVGRSAPASRSDSDDAVRVASPTATTSEANAAILAYLGNAVPAPATLDARYSPDALIAAFRAYGAGAGLSIQTLAVDESEFPFLVYGVVAGGKGLPGLKEALSKGTDYAYGGSVVGTTASGATYFSVNMVPSSRYPAGSAESINRRLMVRLQMLAKRVQR